MKKAFLALILFLTIFSKLALSCYTPDSKFKLKIYNLSIDFDKLIKICTKDKCTITSEYISTRSSYDERVALIFWLEGTVEITTPFYKDDSGEVKPIEINPDTYNWKDSVKKDLEILKDVGIIRQFTLTNMEIERISNIAKNGKNIYYCNGWWRSFEANCRCPKEEEKRAGYTEEICFKCFREETFYPQLPLRSALKLETVTQNKEKTEINIALLLIFLVFILLVILGIVTHVMKF